MNLILMTKTAAERRAGLNGEISMAGAVVTLITLVLLLSAGSAAQTNCDDGNGPLDSSPPRSLSVQEVIQKLGAAEAAAKSDRMHYSYKQDVLLQTLSGSKVTGDFHEVAGISYDAKGKRVEDVTFAAQSTLQGVQLEQADMDDIRYLMPLMLPADDLAQYNLAYSGRQHVDDLDTYTFEVAPKKKDSGKRYFEGRIWVEAVDFQIVKACGKTGPERVKAKRHRRADLHPIFVTYRQQVDGHDWFPAYTRSDETLQFPSGPTHLRQIIKYSDYKRAAGN